MMLRSSPTMGFSVRGNRRVKIDRTGCRKAPLIVANQMSGKTEPFNENVAQVKRLISRDRKEFLGNEDILDKWGVEFGDGNSGSSEASASGVTDGANPFTTPAAASGTPSTAAPIPFKASEANPFKSSSSVTLGSNPFGTPTPAAPKPFKQSIEPKGLTPDMSPDPIIKESPINILKNIGLTQIVIFLSFSTIIGIMVATFFVVVNAGGVRLAGLD